MTLSLGYCPGGAAAVAPWSRPVSGAVETGTGQAFLFREAAMYQKILVPVDLSEPEMTRIALDAALALAKTAPGAELRLVNVQPLVPVAFIDYIPPNFDEEMREAAEKDLSALAAKVDLPHPRVSSTVRFGAIYPEVLAEAEDWRADLIVVGSHRPTMATYLLGSNAKTIVRHAKCSVLVVRR